MTHARRMAARLAFPLASRLWAARQQDIVYEDGIHLDFARNFHYIKAPGSAPLVAPFASLFTFTGDNLSKHRGANGLLVSSVTNTPRIEYDANGNLLGLLIEGARTNLSLQSETFQTTWSIIQGNAFGAGSVVNATIAPDGTTTADFFQENNANAQHIINQCSITGLTAATVYTASCWIKANGRTKGRILFIDGLTIDGVGAIFDLVAGTITGTPTFGAGTLTASGIQAYASGWYRVWVSGAMNNAKTTGGIYINTRDASGTDSYAGDNTSGLYLWGAQVEAGSFPSSYIPTTTVSVTRAAEYALRTPIGSGVYNDLAGTTFCEFSVPTTGGTFKDPFWIGDNSTNQNALTIWAPNGSGSINAIVFSGGLSSLLTSYGAIAVDTRYKIAMAAQLNDFASAMNGSAVTLDAVGPMPVGVDRAIIGSASGPNDFLFGHIRRLDYWPERKSNDLLQTLTR